MEHIFISASEYIYPDIHQYKSGADRADIHAARGGYACGQILLTGLSGPCAVSAKLTGGLSGLDSEFYEMVAIPVEANPFLTQENALPHCPERWAPFEVYDCLKPLEDTLSPRDGTAALYFSLPIPRNAAPGVLSGAVEVRCGQDTVSLPVTLTIHRYTVPEASPLRLIVGFHPEKVAQYHGVESGSPAHARLNDAYLKYLRRMHQNMVYIGGVSVQRDGEGNYTFDFSELEKNVAHYRSLGFEYFQMQSVGGRRSWHEPTILVGPEKLPAMGYEAYRYLSQYLPALRRFLLDRDLMPYFTLGVSDEPNEANATEFRALCGLVRKFIPEIRLLDALSYVPVHGALDVWVPLNSEYEQHRDEFESFRVGSDEIWHYVCCGPRGNGYINRFMDYPLLATRYLFWGNYLYNLTGHLHWASNCYQPGQDPFRQNCPEHRNADSTTILPPGDTHILYPGNGAPWMSIRLEAQREGVEEYGMLRTLAQRDKAAADRLCRRGFRGFKDVEYDPVAFDALRRDLLTAVSALE